MAIHLLRLLTFVGGAATLVGFSYIGKWLAPLLPVVVPAPLIGMLLLFLVFVVLGKIPGALEVAAKPLLAHMSLLFIPAVIGVWLYRNILTDHWLPLLFAVVISTLVVLAITAKLVDKLKSMQRYNGS